MNKILRFPELKQITGLSRSTIWRLEKLDMFPLRKQISRRCIGWDAQDVQDWIEQQGKLEHNDV